MSLAPVSVPFPGKKVHEDILHRLNFTEEQWHKTMNTCLQVFLECTNWTDVGLLLGLSFGASMGPLWDLYGTSMGPLWGLVGPL